MRLDAFSWGGYVVHGQLMRATGSVEFEARTSTYPRGMILIAMTVAVAWALRIWRKRARRARRTTTPERVITLEELEEVQPVELDRTPEEIRSSASRE